MQRLISSFTRVFDTPVSAFTCVFDTPWGRMDRRVSLVDGQIVELE
jgi:hypothetical protein